MSTKGVEEEREIAGCRVVVTKPLVKPLGVTFLLTAANIPLSKYDSIRDALISINHVVVGYCINALCPLWGNHRIKAEEVHDMFKELNKDYRVFEYNIVGHSIGGKIALMVAALHDEDKALNSVVALDPVDQSPVEFTKEKGKGDNISLQHVGADITMTITESGFFVDRDHNGRAIKSFNPNVNLVLHRNAGHMAYCDEGGELSWKAVMGAGNPDRNEFAKKDAIKIIKGKAQSKVDGKHFKRGAKKLVADTKAAAKELSDDAKTSAQGMGTGMMLKGMLGM